jgi:hypothetical protein
MQVTENDLPEPVRRKLAALKQAATDAIDLHASTYARLRELENSPVQDAGSKAEIAELRRLRDARKLRMDNDRQVVARVVDFVRKNPNLAVYVAPIETRGHSIDEVRTKIKELRSEAAKIAGAGPTREDVRRRARELLSSLAGEPRVDRDGFLRLEPVPAHTERNDADARALRIAYLVAPEATLALIDRLVDESYPAEGDDDATRRIKLRDIDDEILRCERIEEVLVDRELARGSNVVLRRISASPMAILGTVHVQSKAIAA